MKTFIWIGIIVVVAVALMIWGAKGPSIEPPFSLDAIHPLDNVKGNPEASVIIIEYSDFQCPACRTYYFALKQLAVEFGDEVTFIYRHFPLTSHINAELAARAAEAAGKQDKFWEMHDLLFEKQNEWATVSDMEPLFESYATLLNISIEQFREDWKSREIKNLIRAERAHAIKSGAQGTPTFFINGEMIQNPNSVDDFRALIKEAIKKSQ